MWPQSLLSLQNRTFNGGLIKSMQFVSQKVTLLSCSVMVLEYSVLRFFLLC